MRTRWLRVAIVAIIVLMVALTVSFAGCGDWVPPDEPIPEEPIPDDPGGGL
ncbi:MAG: hypothetical protein ACQEP2_03040 [Actinomycetota bacterium]